MCQMNGDPNKRVGRRNYQKLIYEGVKIVGGGLDFEKWLKMVVTERKQKKPVVIKLETKTYTEACYFDMEIWRK